MVCAQPDAGWIARYLIFCRHNVCPLVVGVAQSCFQRHATKAAADAEYADAKKNGLVVLV